MKGEAGQAGVASGLGKASLQLMLTMDILSRVERNI